ncbi:hypothetical protein C1645_775550 [Glomus cerebriforme]|uniref:Uncharacterized protein n=1 Tax=Glomus cerebriforme TaxID=658196 RepID=A0A397SQ14_9GLOM|nr:hypothetical protein C1645_775550 [Glomus cerebriforme]
MILYLPLHIDPVIIILIILMALMDREIHGVRGESSAPGGSYYYSNADGSYFYQNSDGSRYYNNGNGYSRYYPPRQ